MTDAVVRTLPELLRRQARERPTRPAIVSGDRTVSYAALDAAASRVANALIADGVIPGARVALLARDSDASYAVLFGCAKAGAVALSVNWRLAPREIAFILQDAQAELVFVGRDFAAQLASVRAELPGVRRIIAMSSDGDGPTLYDWLAGHGDGDPGVPCGPDDVVFQLYTSGTTGSPKGAQLAHRSLFALLDDLARERDPWIEWTPRDVLLLPLPSFHIAGVWWMVRCLAAGATCVVMEGFVGWQVLDHIARHRVTKLCAVPAMLAVLLAEPGCRTTDFSSLTHVIYGASPVAQALLEQALATFGCAMVQIYGMTETGNVAVSLRAEDHTLPGNPRMRSAGRALPGVTLKIIDPQGRVLPPRQIGEICIHSRANMVGYWHLDQATAETLQDGWIHSGDAGFLDEGGYLFIQDRVKDMIIYAGENIYPAEIENALHDHPAIAEVAVIGVPDHRWGETVKAVVVLRPGAAATAEDIIGFARARIAEFKVPRSVDFAAALPRTPSGKLKKAELRAPYWKGRERQVN
ncbi:MAG: long-chain-fatty-acid--CoA ligase [Deltaproteobacteria bacterium]|nr:MAG: long-chain-fatty-acid--CoA ligase [Deltaproteobacteria bacterium]TMQ17228.1 MAG: long-chain-fatty-acid--CoA ligase [Deltaproteobacteria bacterium]